jgi:hypothetical protein
MNAIARRLYELNFGRAQIAYRAAVQQILQEAAGAVDGHKFSLRFLMTEWEQVVDAWQLESWEAYCDVARLGRKTRLAEKQRVVLWSIFERVRSALKTGGLVTYSDVMFPSQKLHHGPARNVGGQGASMGPGCFHPRNRYRDPAVAALRSAV